MKFLLKTSLIFMALVTASLHAQSSGDEARIRALATHWESAWNRHDMKALAAPFTDDADFVNVGARHWKGRSEIEAQHAARLHQFVESTWATREVTVQFLSPNISLVHVSWDLKGDKDPDGTPREPRGGVFTWVVVKERGEWLIRAAQNTNRGNLPSPPAMK
ncbi:SgcJ/EcaC family oxidoreductase [Pseudoxanthomonas kaohsiungensis]|uniref:SgcJ/EcaC family oxidoreductase n=1 Tax=Pseudoxanthomonas kaohsiungensis TaxID=283923 RepID=UPI0035B2AEA2